MPKLYPSSGCRHRPLDGVPMSTENNTSQDAEHQAEIDSGAEGTELVETPAQPEDSSAGPVIVSFIVGLVVSMILGWVIFPALLYSKQKQPFNFNHKLHLEQVDEDCESCHYFRDDGSFSGIPSLDSCLDCHDEMLGESEDEAIFIKEYVEKDREVPWLVYSRQPACVYFSHAAHVVLGKMDCEACHGHIGESEVSRVYEENRITGYSRDIWGKNIAGFKRNSWDRMKMDDCAECHAEVGVGILRDRVKNPVQGYFLELVGMVWPTTTTETKGTSVQTERDGCLVCHK